MKDENKMNWKQVLNEILNSKYIREFIKDVIKQIETGKPSNENIAWGFGEDCHYKRQRELLEDAIYQAFDNDIEYECPTLLQWLYNQVQERLQYEIMGAHHLKEYITISHYTKVVRIDIDYDELLETAHDYVKEEIDKMTDQEIKQYIANIRAEVVERGDF